MPHVDLDAKRAARHATAGEPFSFTFGGEEFSLAASTPDRVPIDALEAFVADDLFGFIGGLLGAEQWARFRAHRPDLGDIQDLAEGFAGYFGFTSVGESQASGD